MVTSPHALASAAGVDALKAGGSAVDAAIAASAVLSVVYPHMTGIGGDAFWLIHEGKTGRVRYLSGGGRAAASATLSWFAAKGLGEIPLKGIVPATLTVPGAVASWTERMRPTAAFRSAATWKRLSTTHATAFPVTERLASFIDMARDDLAAHRESGHAFSPRRYAAEDGRPSCQSEPGANSRGCGR